jgi:hypothetical protein
MGIMFILLTDLVRNRTTAAVEGEDLVFGGGQRVPLSDKHRRLLRFADLDKHNPLQTEPQKGLGGFETSSPVAKQLGIDFDKVAAKAGVVSSSTYTPTKDTVSREDVKIKHDQGGKLISIASCTD